MWGSVEDRPAALRIAIDVTGDAVRYGRLMRRVIREWPVSCENALTDMTINRKAWIGHAAMALGYKIPEDIVRQAWGKLTNEQRQLANRQAEDAICAWECRRQSSELHTGMGTQMLLGWNT